MSKPAPLQNSFDGGQRQDDARNRPGGQSSWTMKDLLRGYGAPARGRGGWAFHSSAVSAITGTASYIRGGIYAAFATTGGGVNAKNLAVDEDGLLYSVNAGTASLIGTALTLAQNPVFIGGTSISAATAVYSGLVIIPDGTGAAVPKKYDGTTLSDLRGLPPKAKFATVYKGYVALANGTAYASTAATGTSIYYPSRLWFSRLGDPEAAFSGTATTAWDLAEGWIDFSETIKGLGATKNAIIVFHEGGTISRVRGSTAPPTEDMEVDDPFLALSLLDPFSITTNKDNVYFCAQEGVFRTDGVVIDDITKKGGMLRYWLDLAASATTAYTFATGVIRDYLFISVMNGSSFVDAFMVDMQSYVWTRLSNMKAISYWSGALNSADETFFAHRGDTRVGRLDSIFAGVGMSAFVNDGDGTAVTPVWESNFFELGPAGLKRLRRLFVGYELDDLTSANPTVTVGYITHPEDTSYTTAGTLNETTTYSRVMIPVNQRLPGIALKFTQNNAGSLHLHDLEADIMPQEGSKRG